MRTRTSQPASAPQEPLPWQDSYVLGTIRRSESTPSWVLGTCMDWYNGLRSAMLRFVSSEAIKPSALLTEARKALVENNQGQPEQARLQRLIDWTLEQQRLCKAAQALQRAELEFRAASQALALSPYDVERIRQSTRAPGP